MIPVHKKLLVVLVFVVFVGLFFPRPALAAGDASISEISSALSGYSTRTLSDFGNLTTDVWSYLTRALTLGAVNTKIERLQELVAATSALQSVLGVETEEKPNLALEEKQPVDTQPEDTQLATGGVDIVRIAVPVGSRVNLRSQPDTAASVLAKIKDTREGARIDESQSWTQVVLEDLDLEGWISTEFIEEGKPTEEGKPDNLNVLGSEVGRFVRILDTPTGWVRVRETPWGTEIGRVYPGDKLTYLDEVEGWVQVGLQDGSKGWIFKKYTIVE
ncbi:MAG: SH3 domain-containing protein [Candidatus Blackburnbacteria bacterium]|nr:SH3 domain-containing protein [Candidatus Blackburnbacteria bacterium]